MLLYLGHCASLLIVRLAPCGDERLAGATTAVTALLQARSSGSTYRGYTRCDAILVFVAQADGFELATISRIFSSDRKVTCAGFTSCDSCGSYMSQQRENLSWATSIPYFAQGSVASPLVVVHGALRSPSAEPIVAEHFPSWPLASRFTLVGIPPALGAAYAAAKNQYYSPLRHLASRRRTD